MVQNLTHDLKTPLSSITSYAEGLKEGIISQSDEQQKAYSVLIKQSQRISMMFDELTSVMEINHDHKHNYPLETIYLDKLFVTLLQSYEQQIVSENRTIDINLCEDITYFKQYKVPLERILMNILDNAFKYTQLGSRLKLKLRKKTAIYALPFLMMVQASLSNICIVYLIVLIASKLLETKIQVDQV